jgi:tetratricopeptide (TPR) repeat protein
MTSRTIANLFRCLPVAATCFYACKIDQAAFAARPDPVAMHNKNVMYRAHMAFDGRRLTQARQLVEPLCFRPDSTADMYCLLAECYMDDYQQNSADFARVESVLRAAIKADPSYSQAYKDMAEFNNLQGEYKKAIEYGIKATQCPHPVTGAYRQTAIAYSNLGQYDKALTEINTFLSTIKSEEPPFIMKAGILEKMKRWDDAVAVYRQAFKIRPQDVTMYSITRCLESAHKYDEAVNEISKLIKINPADSEALSLRAKLHKENKNYAGALNDLSSALQIDPSARIYKERASVNLLLGRKQAADSDIAAAKKIDAKEY